MMLRLILKAGLLCSLLTACNAFKAAEVPLYRKDMPYCMTSFRLNGDFKEKEIWSLPQQSTIADYRMEKKDANAHYCPQHRDMTALQVDLGELKRIAGLVVLGETPFWVPYDPDNKGNSPWWYELWTHYATHYTVEYSPDGRIWMEINDEQGQPRHFKVYQQYESGTITMKREREILQRAHLQTLDPHLHARFIRINVKAYIRRACISFIDIIGCDSDLAISNIQRVQEPTKPPRRDQCNYITTLGMESGEIKDYQIEASSYKKISSGKHYFPFHARWGRPGKKKWCAYTGPYYPVDVNPWITVRLGSWPKYLSKIEYKKDTKAYNMHIYLSLDGKSWSRYENYMRSGRVVTMCCGWYILSFLVPPVKIRFVRFSFTRTQPKGPFKACLMFELFGCSAETQTLAYFPMNLGRVYAGFQTTPNMPNRDFRSLSLSGDPYWSWCPILSVVFSDFGNPFVKEKGRYNIVRLDMKGLFAVSKIVVKGDTTKSGGCGAYTRSLVMMYGMDDQTWVLIRLYNGNKDFRLRPKILPAVQSPCAWAPILISPTAYGRYFKFVPIDYYKHQCLRIELIGFEPGTQPVPPRTLRKTSPACSSSLGMKSGAIKKKRITASSHLPGAPGNKGRLEQPGGWCVNKLRHVGNYTAINNSLEIDLRTEHIIDGFASQGFSTSTKKRWVTAYVVHFSLDGISWAVISMREQERVFVANRDPSSVMRHYLNPRVRARYIKFVPVAWNNWPCMRVEIYGCSDGTSYESRLFKTLRDLETKKLAMVPLNSDSKVSFNCGDYETWGHTNYLKVNLDRGKSVWYQKAFSKDFPLLEKTLTLSSNQFPSDFGNRHFMCTGRTRDGMDIFWQHLIAVQQGPDRTPEWLSPNDNMRTMPSAAIPQIVVLQRFDPAYDGGFPVWSVPAIIKASGNMASLAVYVVGIPYYPILIHNCLVEDRLSDWHLTHLGTIPRNDHRACARLALSKGYEYMTILSETECLSSWFLPLATSPHRARDHGQCRLEPKVYFIKATFQEYLISWYKKVDDDKHPWKPLFSYFIKPRERSSPHVFSVATNSDPHREKLQRYSHFGHYQTFDKALFGDTYIGSHVMDIRDLTLEDLGTYKFKVEVLPRVVMNEAIIVLRHENEPEIDLPEKYEACENVVGSMTVQTLGNDLLDPEQVEVEDWYNTIIVGDMVHRYSYTRDIMYTVKGKWKETFVWKSPHPFMNGQYFEVFVKNRYGLATALSKISVVPADETPALKWITPSPFQAIEGMRQTLEVKPKTDKQLQAILWFHNGKPIEAATDRYGFPESTAGIRKKLKLIKIDEKTPGNYGVVIKGKSCEFERNIKVKVIVIPRVFFLPRADYVRAKVDDKQAIFNVTVKGGDPKPKLQQMTWKKGKSKLIPSYRGRIVLFTTLDENNNWFSVLKIRQLRIMDTADYTFEVRSGPATTKKLWRLSVRPKIVNITLGPNAEGQRPQASPTKYSATAESIHTITSLTGVLTMIHLSLSLS